MRKWKLDALTADHVSFRYFPQNKGNILDHVNFHLEAGKITVLTGKSGCGKSTLAAVLAGLYPENGGVLEEGQIRLQDRELREMSFPQRACQMSMMFQNPDLQFCMDTLRKEMAFCLENISCPREEMDGRIFSAAEKLHMTEYLDRELHTLSGGEKQKAQLACILLLGSRILILDEPFANIDPEWTGRILAILKEWNEKYGTTILAVDHDLEPWLSCLDQVVIMESGGKMHEGITADNLKDYHALFEQEGLRWPFSDRKPKDAQKPGQAVIRLNHTNIFAGNKPALLRKREGQQDLIRDAACQIYGGRMTALLGASGSGKTTLFRTLLRQQAYEGSILLRGRELKTVKEKKLFSQMGIVFQNPSNQFVTNNVLDEIKAGLQEQQKRAGENNRKSEERIRKETKSDKWKNSPESCRQNEALEREARRLLAEFHLEKYVKYSPYMLSQGQQRRLAVLAVLAGNQKILLLDEPTYGQDYAMTQEIMGLLQKKVKEEGLTVIFSSHDISVVREWADHILRIENGRLVSVETDSSAGDCASASVRPSAFASTIENAPETPGADSELSGCRAGEQKEKSTEDQE